MADLIFDRITSQLTWPTKNRWWGAISGPWGLGPLPKGSYRIERKNVTELTSQMKASFLDRKEGKGFFLPLTPLFQTSRSNLGIHPDGGQEGTEGCIGLVSGASDFYRELELTPIQKNLTLEVK